MAYTDIVLYDLKHIDSAKHKEGTGVDIGPIMENLSKTAEIHPKLIVRIPLIPGFNMDSGTIEGFIKVLKRINTYEVHLLPFHQLGSQKYVFVGKDYSLKDLKVPEDAEIDKIQCMFKEMGISTFIGG